ncbi:phosphatidylinositol 4-kinase [Niveomyces insectorum RCEF 264]|uniref:1-phosphatidylinositol 4-kinase n=1 Tax=Niveomyces insectorum RCEF 264 TaxID=1081102 RepID=A0A167M0E6_9HYPO|nr:phosphatidylinositol 4-kinase [Niveomyces insectorum RCEF 264]
MATRDIRQRALQKIAALSAVSTSTAFEKSDLDRLCKACPSHAKVRDNGSNAYASRSLAGRVPMTIREFEVLLALCKAAPLIQSSHGAQRLTRQLIPYILDSHVQAFAPSPFFRRVVPSPTEALAFHVTAALLSLGINHDDGVHDAVSDNIWAFLNACARITDNMLPSASSPSSRIVNGSGSVNGSATTTNATTTSASSDAGDDNGNLEDAIRTATIAVALLGFLDAAAAQAEFWRAGGRLALVSRLRKMLSEPFLVAVETAFSTIRNAHATDRVTKEWKRHLRHYWETGRPLGAMLLQRSFMHLLAAATSLLVAEVAALKRAHVLDLLLAGEGLLRPMSARSGDADFQSVEIFANAVVDQMSYLEASSDFIRLGSAAQQTLSFAVKASALISYLNCSRLNESAADADVLMGWLEDTLADPVHMADENLSSVVLKSLALICKLSPDYAASVSRLLPRYIVQSGARGESIDIASSGLASVLRMLSTDAVITTLYTLGNVLSAGNERALTNGTHGELAGGLGSTGLDSTAQLYQGRQSTGSSISLQFTGEEETSHIYGNVVQAICGIAGACKDPKITALAQSMLLQRIDQINGTVDAKIIPATAVLALTGGQLEFRSLLKTFTRLCHVATIENKPLLLTAVRNARNYLSSHLKRDSPLYEIYWEHMFDDIISKGDVHQTHHAKATDVELAACEIAELLQPLAVFVATNEFASDASADDEIHALIRDAWFNIVVHGFSSLTERGEKYWNELRIMAVHSPPLVAEQRGEQVESDIELNTVLRRGMSSDREAMQKKMLIELVPSKASEIRGLSYRKVIFLQAAYLVESLRADAGDCTKAISYFLEPSMRRGDVSSIMEGVTAAVVDQYLRKTLSGSDVGFSAQYAASQLAALFCSCCHRIERVQQAAYACADRIIRDVPSALCHRSSLFALLELLSLMWTSCLESETDQYAPRSCFTSAKANLTVELSDNYDLRQLTLNTLYKKAKAWVSGVLSLAPADVKGLLQTYLSERTDDGSYGHISLGRSFALKMGFSIPSSDQRLTSLDRFNEWDVNTASDFVSQYTSRQEYRYAEPLPDRSMEWLSFMRLDRRSSFLPNTDDAESTDAVSALAHIEARVLQKKPTPLSDVRDILRRAASLLCRSQGDQSAIAQFLVSIPFAMFTKASIQLGISLWLGVMNENPRMEPRIFYAVLQQWELSAQRRLGLFNTAITDPDPFFVKMEFAPSDSAAMAKQQQHVHDLLSPHTRLLQFLQSHFNATRLGSVDIQKGFLRMLDITLDAVRTAGTSHPMARELRFQIVLFGLRVLRYSSTISAIAQWRLKDKILSAALSWFASSLKWSFGSNNLQLKTEIRLLADVITAVKAVAYIGAHQVGNTVKSLQAKEQLLLLLMENEQTRLSVWVHPLSEPARTPLLTTTHSSKEVIEALLPLVRTAWQENPSLAMELATRFQNPRLHKKIRWLLLNFPDRAISVPDALPILVDGSLPVDYLLFWAPVNPITAVTYFMPSFENHPFLIQYAMRALESHSVDVTFFYVPQIVQTLRYDALGYAARYILETAQFSQLFAHQIIWNMKANAYKDDEAQIPDAIKPTLDNVMSRMIEAFLPADRLFYEREFAFFDEVTDISGKLKPLIKRSKPEKKQKIEEELRKIKVEVGVYLPSNPDGVVIGIDRKSGKPLQSHAKAPFMATFRIKKAKGGEQNPERGPYDGDEDAVASVPFGANGNGVANNANHSNALTRRSTRGSGHGGSNSVVINGAGSGALAPDVNTIELWQSAIFKVGDDCRQDLLALQMIAAFRGIFQSVGLDVFVFPYRVTATAPGCGVIDVLPNSVSRDMLGREAVNGLYDYFISKYGNEDALRFQAARSNFVKSMAAYSVISFLLQFKDRHNGNIMIDDAGHILHVDFGFCFDIAPGGIKFERAPFKLTSEMLAVMGGSTDQQSFRWFEELCIKAFLAARPYTEKLSQLVLLMMNSGLPCFKPESVRHFRERFVLEKTEREAADFMRDLIKKSYASYSTGLYDQYQWMTNGIPYASS